MQYCLYSLSLLYYFEEWEATKEILSDKEKVKTQAKACGYQLKEKYFLHY